MFATGWSPTRARKGVEIRFDTIGDRALAHSPPRIHDRDLER